MMKKIYVAPNIRVREIENESLMQSSRETGISDTPATGGGQAKGSLFSSEPTAGIGTSSIFTDSDE